MNADGARRQRNRARLAGGLRLIEGVAGASRAGQRLLSPLLDLGLRLIVAQMLFMSAAIKLADWEKALFLSRHEYPVAWMDPVLAAWLGLGTELLVPPLLVLGLFTRLAAVPVLILALVIQIEYRQFDVHLAWALLALWWLVHGAGALSLDRLLARGLARSVLPFDAAVRHAGVLLRRYGEPLFLLGLRCWLAVLLFPDLIEEAAARADLPLLLGYPAQQAVLSDRVEVMLAPGWNELLPWLLALGLFTRPLFALVALLATIGGMSGHGWWLLLALLMVLHGAGPLSLDRLLALGWRALLETLRGRIAEAAGERPHVLIVGAGFGGLAAARALRHAACRVTLVDRRNYHLFQPLLYQVATAALSPADIATPIREMFRDQPNCRVVMGRVRAVDAAAGHVALEDGRRLAFDHLVLATGARHAYFGKDHWEPHAPGLKKIDDATDVRRRLLTAFEMAENASDEAERQAWLTFAIVGAGPTGVELAGAIAELARHGMTGEFDVIDPASARVLLIQSGPRVLPAFDTRLSEATRAALERTGVTVLTGARVQEVDGAGLLAGERRIACRTVFWAAGVAASPAGRWLGAATDGAGRVRVNADLTVGAWPNIFAIGDTAASEAWNGAPVPGLAPAAKQGGQYVADLIRRRLEGRPPPPPFRYRHMGSLATIGREAAVAQFGPLHLHGALAWWLWGVVHVLFLADMRNRISVALEWAWAYLTYRRSTRLITGN